MIEPINEKQTTSFPSSTKLFLPSNQQTKKQIQKLVEVHYPNLHYLHDKIFISDTVQEIVMWILICIKKQHNNYMSQAMENLRVVEKKYEKEENENFSFKLKIDELLKENNVNSVRLRRKEEQCRKKEESQFQLKTKIENLQKVILVNKTNYQKRIKELKRDIEGKNQKISDLQSLINEHEMRMRWEKGAERKNSRMKRKHMEGIQSKRGERFEHLRGQIQQLRENQSKLLDLVAERDQTIQELKQTYYNQEDNVQ